MADDLQAVYPPLRPAAQYLRMSTEHQRYSLEHQARTIGAYAQQHGYEIVRTYTDAGKSGLTLKGREQLSELLKAVVAGGADYETVLVLDVSRWGRFQDPDEAAHYEFVCRSSGVAVEYCAELFENDGSLFSSLVKQLKRTMAAEYSRDLSVRIAAVQRGLAAQGYRICGPTGYGLRRMMLDPAGQPAGLLQPRQRKAYQGHRLILVPGPPEEVAVIQRIFREFVHQGRTQRAIARGLNEDGIPGEAGRRWSDHGIAGILSNEKYIGNNVFGRTRKALGRRSKPTPEETWTRCNGAFAPLVSARLFKLAQKLRAERAVRFTDDQMLRALKRLWRREGYLAPGMINSARTLPCVALYQHRFGSLAAAYARIGYRRNVALYHRHETMSDEVALERLRALLEAKGRLCVSIINGSPTLPGAAAFSERFGSLRAAYARIGYVPTSARLTRERTDGMFDRDAMLEGLRRLLAREGKITVELIDADPSLRSRCTYFRRFGSLSGACALIGYEPPGPRGAAAHAAHVRRARLGLGPKGARRRRGPRKGAPKRSPDPG